MFLVLFPLALADSALEPAPPDECEVFVVTSVPARDGTDLPLDLVPVLFTTGGCGEELRAEVRDAEGTIQARTPGLVPAGDAALVLETPVWTAGSWSIELVETNTGDRIDRFDFEVGDQVSQAPPPPDVQGLYPRSDGTVLRVEVALADPPEGGVVELTDADGNVALGPTDLQTQPVFDGVGAGGTLCYDVRVRGPGAAWSDAVEACGEVVVVEPGPRGHQFFGGCGCDSSAPGAPLGLLLLTGLAGLRRRR